MTTAKITTLSEFLYQSGAEYRVFDMGRRVVKLSSAEFIDFELAKKPYPYPFQQTALLGVVFWNPATPEQHYVWFLKFPLDEQGLLLQVARDEFLVMLLDRVGECMLAASEGNKIEGALKDSPYTFNPRDDKMAAFNAQATKALSIKPSHYYDDALAYFTGQKDLDEWRVLGLQGVADIAIRLDEHKDVLGLIETIPKLADEPFQILSTFLEHASPDESIVEVLAQRLDAELQEKEPDNNCICSCLRAVSNSSVTALVEKMVLRVLQHECSVNVEILAIISGRMEQVLKQEEICQHFVEQLADNDAGYTGFSHLLADIMYMPGMREYIMQALRSPNRSDKLSRLVGQLFS